MHKVCTFVYIYSQWQNHCNTHEAYTYDDTTETWNHNKSDINYKAGVARYVETMKSYY